MKKQTKFLDNFPVGRMISATKTSPKNNICVFNANICTKSKGKIWYGDLNITTEQVALQEYANEVGETIYVLREKDARFTTENKPVFENAVATFEPKRKILLDDVVEVRTVVKNASFIVGLLSLLSLYLNYLDKVIIIDPVISMLLIISSIGFYLMSIAKS